MSVQRSQLKNAPYNPRKISDKAKVKLRANLKRVGMLEPLIWNERTGNLVGGHQRIAALDSLMGTQDYALNVAKVDLDEKTEREQNVFLNNPEAQGEFDLEKLGLLFKDDQINNDFAGFDIGDVYQLFGDSPVIQQPEQLQAIADGIRKAKETYDVIAKKNAQRNDTNYYSVVVYRDVEQRDRVHKLMGTDTENRFVNGDLVEEIAKRAAHTTHT